MTNTTNRMTTTPPAGRTAERAKLQPVPDGKPGPTRARWAALHWTTRAGAVAGALVTALLLAPVAAAVLLVRCCGSAQGASPWAWALIMTLVAIVALAAGGLAAAVVAGIRALAGRARRA